MLAETQTPVNRLRTSLDAASRALFGTPTAPILTLCDERECGSHAAACLTVAEADARGEWLIPTECRVCGGWYAAPEVQ